MPDSFEWIRAERDTNGSLGFIGKRLSDGQLFCSGKVWEDEATPEAAEAQVDGALADLHRTALGLSLRK